MEVARSKRNLLVAPIVPRHIDFLESLSTQSKLPVKEPEIKKALSQTDILIGSAPVGPIPRSFKGDILYAQLKQDFWDSTTPRT